MNIVVRSRPHSPAVVVNKSDIFSKPTAVAAYYEYASRGAASTSGKPRLPLPTTAQPSTTKSSTTNPPLTIAKNQTHALTKNTATTSPILNSPPSSHAAAVPRKLETRAAVAAVANEAVRNITKIFVEPTTTATSADATVLSLVPQVESPTVTIQPTEQLSSPVPAPASILIARFKSPSPGITERLLLSVESKSRSASGDEKSEGLALSPPTMVPSKALDDLEKQKKKEEDGLRKEVAVVVKDELPVTSKPPTSGRVFSKSPKGFAVLDDSLPSPPPLVVPNAAATTSTQQDDSGTTALQSQTLQSKLDELKNIINLHKPRYILYEGHIEHIESESPFRRSSSHCSVPGAAGGGGATTTTSTMTTPGRELTSPQPSAAELTESPTMTTGATVRSSSGSEDDEDGDEADVDSDDEGEESDVDTDTAAEEDEEQEQAMELLVDAADALHDTAVEFKLKTPTSDVHVPSPAVVVDSTVVSANVIVVADKNDRSEPEVNNEEVSGVLLDNPQGSKEEKEEAMSSDWQSEDKSEQDETVHSDISSPRDKDEADKSFVSLLSSSSKPASLAGDEKAQVAKGKIYSFDNLFLKFSCIENFNKKVAFFSRQ
jgi:hypothetical protein